MEISLSQSLFHIETQFEADLTEPGFGARAHMECITSHSEGVERGKKIIPANLTTNIIAGIRFTYLMSST